VGIAEEKPQEALRIRLLGSFRVSVGPRTVGENGWRLKKAKSLVKLLALAPGHQMHREQLAQWLWPNSSDSKAQANSLRQALYAARRTLAVEPDSSPTGATSDSYLRLLEDQVALCPEGPLWVDVAAFEEAVTTARRVREPAAYRAAIDLYAGELLPEDRYEEWVQERREGLKFTHLFLLLELAVLYEERGEFEGAIGVLRKAVVEEPTNEEAQVGLMRMYSAIGRQGEALLQYERLRKALSEELGVEKPGEAARHLYQEIRAGRAPEARTTGEETRGPSPGSPADPFHFPRHNLPVERTSFVGREDEMVEVERLLSMTGLLTLTGAGGAGKTRFALALARKLAGTYPDGAWLVELAPLSEPELVERTVAAALGVREQPGRSLTDTLKDSLRVKKLLLVLDNCEHLVEAAALLAEALLDSCPNLKVLATSREALNITGELVWRVSSLSVPDKTGNYYSSSMTMVEELRRYESVRLFVERARYRRPSFELTSENAGAVAEVCRRLEGIPLAIELGAARVGVLSVEQIAARLKDSLGVLAGGSRTAEPRQRTLRGALEWSFDLLGEPERDLFCQLSVFAGGWTLEAAEAVCSWEDIEPSEVLDLLSRLVDKSLAKTEIDGPGEELRYGMLEPVRQYGLERLEERGEAETVRRRHAAWCLAFAEGAERELSGPEQSGWLEKLETEHDNLRAALRWTLAGGKAELGLGLAAALWSFWYTRGHLSEGRRWLESTISEAGPLVTLTKAKALNGVGYISIFQGEYEAAKEFLEEGLVLYRELGDTEGIASSLIYLGFVAVLGQRDLETVPALYDEAAGLGPELQDRRVVANLLLFSGLVAISQGDLERGLALNEESLALFRQIGDIQGMGHCLNNLGIGAVLQADYNKASALLRENLRMARESDYKLAIQYSFLGLGYVAACREQPARAARLWGAVEAMGEAFGIGITPITRSHTNYDGYLASARSQLTETVWKAAWEEGRAMTLEQAIEYTLSAEEEQPATASMPEETPVVGYHQAAALTPREREVAMLVAQEMTNRQIAQELSISERTVATHVHKILDKLNLRSRIQIYAWATEQELLR
jgi:predicted ATPase/DNA-binding SARP family transcriptional activator/DNA-binding CsgD family transcriptional regulator